MAETIGYEDFAKVELRVATVLEARPHPNADKLLLLQIDVGDEQKQIVAGIRAHYTPEQLVGKRIIVVNNLQSAMLRGESSNGMLLAATSDEGKVIVLTVDDPSCDAGAKIKSSPSSRVPSRSFQSMRREYGDFQTPTGLVAAVLARLGVVGVRWPRVFEPTCGRGHFLAGLLAFDPPPREILGIELQEVHLAEARIVARSAPAGVHVGLIAGSLFDVDLRELAWSDRDGPMLVVGNPPWVTSAELGNLNSTNRPPRSNPKAVRGLDAITGRSNFDAAESVWIKLLTELADQEPTVALLCKTAVARNVLEHARTLGLPITEAEVVRLDARQWFGASVEACLLRITLGKPVCPINRIPVYRNFDATEPESEMGFAGDRLVIDFEAYTRVSDVDGVCPIHWRQGLKHDAADVMEFSEGPDGSLRNGLGELPDIESDHLYALLKGTDLARPTPSTPRRAVVVTQRGIGEDTARLETSAPRLWAYLRRHDERFARRKSSIYRGRSPYSIFGIGPYAFSPFKVAVSGLHKEPLFQAVGPVAGRPVMCDDTSYFLPCHSARQAALIATLLNRPEPVGLLKALTTPGAKRPITKSSLQRINLRALLTRADRRTLLDQADEIVARLTGRTSSWPRPLSRLIEPWRDAPRPTSAPRTKIGSH